MVLIDDPQAWILRLFEMEEREGRGENCRRFAEGTAPDGVPLDIDERVFGIYKEENVARAEASEPIYRERNTTIVVYPSPSTNPG